MSPSNRKRVTRLVDVSDVDLTGVRGCAALMGVALCPEFEAGSGQQGTHTLASFHGLECGGANGVLAFASTEVVQFS